MPFDEFPAAVRHPRAPRSPDFEFGLSTEEMQGDSEAEGPGEVEEVVEDDGERDDEGLRGFGAVDPCEDVDAICAERGEQGHVQVVQRTCRRARLQEEGSGTNLCTAHRDATACPEAIAMGLVPRCRSRRVLSSRR